MDVNEISFENLPKAVAHLTSEIAEIKSLVQNAKISEPKEKRIPIGIEDVCKIKASTLLIRGDNDFLSSLESYVQLQKNIENSSILNIPFSEHIVFAEQPQIVEIALKEFLLKN